MLIIMMLLVLTIVPFKLIPIEFPEQPVTRSITEPILFGFTLVFTFACTFLLTKHLCLPELLLLTLTYGQACADFYYKLLSPLLLLVQALVSLLWFNRNLFELIACIVVYYLFYLTTSFMTTAMMGLGDIKLLVLLFFSLPLMQFYLCLLCASSLALLYSYTTNWLVNRSLNTQLPFVPFIYIGLSLSFVFL